MKCHLVISSGYFGSNDDYADGGIVGVYSSKEKAIKALRDLMQDELMACTEMKLAKLSKMSFEDLSAAWSEQMDTEEYQIAELDMDGSLLDIYEAIGI